MQLYDLIVIEKSFFLLCTNKYAIIGDWYVTVTFFCRCWLQKYHYVINNLMKTRCFAFSIVFLKKLNNMYEKVLVTVGQKTMYPQPWLEIQECHWYLWRLSCYPSPSHPLYQSSSLCWIWCLSLSSFSLYFVFPRMFIFHTTYCLVFVFSNHYLGRINKIFFCDLLFLLNIKCVKFIFVDLLRVIYF